MASEQEKAQRAAAEEKVKKIWTPCKHFSMCIGYCPYCIIEQECNLFRAQRDWLIKECGRVGVTVNVAIGAPLETAYRLVNTRGKND